MKITTETSVPTLIAETKRYAQTDMLCYRSPDELLAEEQRQLWDPIVKWAEAHYGVSLHLTEGVMPIEQPAETLAALEAAVDKITSLRGYEGDAAASIQQDGGDCFAASRNDEQIRSLAKLTKLLGSLVLCLAVIEKHADADAAIGVAFLEETFQAKKWGEDEEATEKRAAKMAECREVIAALLHEEAR